LASWAQTPDANDLLMVSLGSPRTRLDRARGVLVSEVRALVANPSGTSFLPPVDLAVTIESGLTDRVEMPTANWSPAGSPYGTHTFSLIDPIPDAKLGSGGLSAQRLVFERSKYQRFTYTTTPYGSPYQEGPPVLNLDPLAYVIEQGETLALGMTASDPDGQTVTISASPVLPDARLFPTGGVAAAATFVLAATNGQKGIYFVTFVARDTTGLEDPKTVQITITPLNHPPTVSVPATADVNEGQLLTIPVTGGDPDGDPITISAVPLPDNAVFIQTAGGITFAPDYDQAGVYNITCQADDGADLSVPKTVAVTVNDVVAGGETGELVLVVHPVESPTLVARQRVAGTVNADTNLPPAQTILSALITGLSPATARQGETLNVSITGKSTGNFVTHFAGGVSAAGFGAGITVNNLTVNSESDATANITVAGDAALGARGVTIQTGGETAVAVPAFFVEAGAASVHGTLLDPDSGLPIVGALISIEGALLTAVTAPDGSFTIPDVPPGDYVLLVNPPNHKLLRVPFRVEQGVVSELGSLTSQATVFDPAHAAPVSLHSILQRGMGDIVGRLSIDQAYEMIRDAFLLLGGDEVGVFDAYQEQINPESDITNSVMFINHDGITMYAERMARGEDVGLMEVLYDLSFALDWQNGQRPRFVDLLSALQNLVNQAWADPFDPYHAALISIFTAGRQMPPDPPVLRGDTRLSKMQAMLIVSGVLAAVTKHEQDWLARLEDSSEVQLASLGGTWSDWLGLLSLGTRAYAADPPPAPGRYTFTWESLMTALGTHPTGVYSSVTGGTTNNLPDLEKIFRDYYVDTSAESLEHASDYLLSEFGDNPRIQEILKADPYDVETALDELTRIGSYDIALRERMPTIAIRSGGGFSAGHTIKLDPEKYFWEILTYGTVTIGVGGIGVAYANPMVPAIVKKSWAPNPPYIYDAVETSVQVPGLPSDVWIPAVQILFRPSSSGTSHPGGNYYYRLHRMDVASSVGTSNQLELVAAGNLDDSSNWRAPQKHPTLAGIYYFELLFPPAGMNHYRMDVVHTDRADITAFTGDLNQLETWVAGYLDDPVTTVVMEWGRKSRNGRRAIHPGEGFVRDGVGDYEVSALSKPVAINIRGQGNGLSAYGRVDLTADYQRDNIVFLSIPGYDSDDTDRATGAYFYYNPKTGELQNFLNSSFMKPGPIGLAIDANDRLFTENAATEAAWGGRIWKLETDWDPEPTATGEKTFLSDRTSMYQVGSVNYYSPIIQKAQPVQLHAMVVGNVSDEAAARRSSYYAPDDPYRVIELYDLTGEELYVADGYSMSIKKLDTDEAFIYPGAPHQPVGHNWAWNGTNAVNQAPEDVLNFGPLTDIDFDATRTRMFITQGPYVVDTSGGADASGSITTNGTLFVNTEGCAVCDAGRDQYVFVVDKGADRIFRIPFEDIPIDVPPDPAQKAALINKYTFLEGLNHPSQIAIFDDGRAMVFLDETGLVYHRFGFVGQVLDPFGGPVVNAQVVLYSDYGTQTAVTDHQGYYAFTGYAKSESGSLYVRKDNYTDSYGVNVDYRCGTDVRATPLVLVTNLLDRDLSEVDLSTTNLITDQDSVDLGGVISPTNIDFTVSGGTLEIVFEDGKLHSFPLEFVGEGNSFMVDQIPLRLGDNYIIIKVNANGIYSPGASQRVKVTRVAATVWLREERYARRPRGPPETGGAG